MTLSSRVPRGAAPNPLTRALVRLRADGVAVADLTGSNPTQVELPYPADLLAPLGQPSGLRYEPHHALYLQRIAAHGDHRVDGSVEVGVLLFQLCKLKTNLGLFLV